MYKKYSVLLSEYGYPFILIGTYNKPDMTKGYWGAGLNGQKIMADSPTFLANTVNDYINILLKENKS